MNTQVKSLFLAALILIAVSCKIENKEQNAPIRKVLVEKVQKAELVSEKTFSGIIKDAGEVNLAFRVGGPIKALHVKEGDYVEKGKLVAEIDPRDYEVQAAVAQAQFDQVSNEAGRVAELYNRKSVAVNDFDKAVAGEKLVTTQLKHANDQLNDTKLFAPFSGYIQKVQYEKGEMVDVGMPIASLINVSHYEIEVEIPASLFIMKERFIEFTCQQIDLSAASWPLQMVGFNKKANNTQLYKLHFILDPKVDKQLAPGMNVKVSIRYNNHSENMLSVPVEAVFNEKNAAFVWVYNEVNGKVNKQAVTTDGLTENGGIRIVSGMKGDEIVVIAGVNSLHENQQVEILKSVSETNVGGLL